MNQLTARFDNRRVSAGSAAALVCCVAVAATALAGQGSNGAGAGNGRARAATTQPAAGNGIAPGERRSFREASTRAKRRLEKAQKRLSALRKRIADKKVPLTKRIDQLERKLSELRSRYQQKSRELDSRTLELNNLRSEIESRKKEAKYLSNLLAEYTRNFASRLHIAERHRYRELVEAAKRAPGNDKLTRRQAFEKQVALLKRSLGRIREALGGARFSGRAVAPGGVVKSGRFLLLGPTALFRSEDGAVVGTATEKLNSSRPTVRAFAAPKQAAAARAAVKGTGDRVPLDPTLGKAHKVESTRAGLWAHVKKGGPVMIPIFALAGTSLLVALYKWVALSLQRKPSQKRINELLLAVARDDGEETVRAQAGAIKGPAGRMLEAGVEHMREPRELIEEVMYERVLDTRLKLQRFLPFIAITAAASPLLGLLGTVIGIINTFELITAFGTGDVQTLSGGISEALVTTEFGLIVAIPSLLLHAFLSRKARGITDQMEKAAVAFVNEVMKARSAETASRTTAPATA